VLQNYSLLFCNKFGKKLMALEWAKKLAYTRSSRNSGRRGEEEEVAPSLAITVQYLRMSRGGGVKDGERECAIDKQKVELRV